MALAPCPPPAPACKARSSPLLRSPGPHLRTPPLTLPLPPSPLPAPQLTESLYSVAWAFGSVVNATIDPVTNKLAVNFYGDGGRGAKAVAIKEGRTFTLGPMVSSVLLKFPTAALGEPAPTCPLGLAPGSPLARCPPPHPRPGDHQVRRRPQPRPQG